MTQTKEKERNVCVYVRERERERERERIMYISIRCNNRLKSVILLISSVICPNIHVHIIQFVHIIHFFLQLAIICKNTIETLGVL